MPLICNFVLPCSSSFLESPIENENAVENARICSSRVIALNCSKFAKYFRYLTQLYVQHYCSQEYHLSKVNKRQSNPFK